MSANTTTTTLLALCVGYPFCFRACGMVLATVLMAVSIIASRFSCNLLLWASQISNKRSYEELVEHVMGKAGRQVRRTQQLRAHTRSAFIGAWHCSVTGLGRHASGGAELLSSSRTGQGQRERTVPVNCVLSGGWSNGSSGKCRDGNRLCRETIAVRPVS